MKKIISVILIMVLSVSFFASCSPYTLEQFVEEAKPSIQEISDSLGEQMSMEILARDGKFVYQFFYHIPLDMSNEDAKAALDSELENGKATYIDIAKQMNDAGLKDSTVVVEYIDMNGEVITSVEFTADMAEAASAV